MSRAGLHCAAAFTALIGLAGSFAHAQQRVVYLVPNGYPGSDSIHIVQDGNDERFCALGLEGLDLARSRLGYTPCGSELPRNDTQLTLAERFHNIDALILVDDRSQLSPEAVRLLAGAIEQRFGSNYYVLPFGVELQNPRTSNPALRAGSRAMVVGERLYQDHYKNLPTAPLMWLSTIDAAVRSISSPQATLAPAEINSDAAAREAFQRAVSLYNAGDFERAYWLFSDLARVPDLGRPSVAVMIAITIAAQGGDAFLDGAYQRAFDAWQRFSTSSVWLPDEAIEDLDERHRLRYRRIQDRAEIWAADALQRAGNSQLAAQLYSPETLAFARSARTRTELLEILEVLRNRHGAEGIVPLEPRAADELDPPPGDLAQELMEDAQQLYLSEQFVEAATAFLYAYRIEPEPAFLFNAAVAYERAENYTEAADNFSRYISEKPDAYDADAVRHRIELLRTRALQ